MASSSDTGHARNVANFKTLNNACASMGPIYKPSKPRLQVTALIAQHDDCKVINSAVKPLRIAFNGASSDRGVVFKPLKKLITRLLSIFKTTDAHQQEKDYAKTIADKIRGTKNKPPKVEGQDPHSTAQQSCVMLADNFETFIGLLSAEPTYTPTETELQVETLQTMLANMNTENNKADLALRAWKNALIARNTALYAAGTGLVDTAFAVKDYVKGAVGTSSPHYKAISGLLFKRIEDDPNA